MGMPKKFGMFVHWGIYSLLAYHEQARWRFYTPRDVYAKLAERFNPTAFDPDALVALAKEAGMEYICITTKHHDGFCMFDTKYTDFNIMNTPYGRDILKELADACERGGMALSLYYSNPDWHCPYGYNSRSSHQMPSPDQEEDTVRYRAFVKNQLSELLTNYGKIYTLFWDIPAKIEDPSMNEFVRSLQPDILINDRGWGDKGDFSTPEREVPEGGKFERYTEACQSVGHESWGYYANEDYYTKRFLTSSIDKIFVKDGSYLLNVGPMADGRLPDEAVRLVRGVGDWYQRVREAFDAEPCALLDNHSLLTTRRGDTLYVHIPDGLIHCGLSLKPLNVRPRSVTLLNDGRALSFEVSARPAAKNWQTGILDPQVLHVGSIPADEYAGETMILKIELDNTPIQI